MTNSGLLTVFVTGGIIVTAIVAVMVLAPPWGVVPNDTEPYDSEPPSGISNVYSSDIQFNNPVKYGGVLSPADIFERTESGVVRINVQRDNDVVMRDNGVGSGFVYDMNGHILTNAHVITSSEKIIVTFSDGRQYPAEIIGIDQSTDMAMIKVDEPDSSLLHPIPFGDSSILRVGDPIVAIGNPFGLSGSMTSGIISQLGRLIPSDSTYSMPDIIQTDAAINPGNSGGPLLNMKGEVIGVNNAIQSSSGEFAGVGFAIPSQTVIRVANALMSSGEFQHPWIGISGRNVDLNIMKAMSLDGATGFLVINVTENSPAYEAGLINSEQLAVVDEIEYMVGGDVIVSVDGNDVKRIDDILVYMQRTKSVGDTMNLGLIRDGQMIEVAVTLQARPN